MSFQPTDQQITAIRLLASGQSYSKVAEAVGTSSASICRWMKNPDFKKQIDTIQERKLEATKNVVIEVSAETLQDTLKISMRHQDEIIESTRQITTKCINMLTEVVNRVDGVIRSEDRDTPLTQKEKALLSFMPNLMRNTALLISSVNEAWDRRYSIEEISHRLNDWQRHWDESDRN